MLKEERLYSCEVCDEEMVVKLLGEMDHHNAKELRGEVDSLILEYRPQRVVLDLSEISFMDSSGLGFIMGRYSLAKELGASLVLRAPTPAVMKIITLAGMERMIKIEKSIKEGDV